MVTGHYSKCVVDFQKIHYITKINTYMLTYGCCGAKHKQKNPKAYNSTFALPCCMAASWVVYAAEIVLPKGSKES